MTLAGLSEDYSVFHVRRIRQPMCGGAPGLSRTGTSRRTTDFESRGPGVSFPPSRLICTRNQKLGRLRAARSVSVLLQHSRNFPARFHRNYTRQPRARCRRAGRDRVKSMRSPAILPYHGALGTERDRDHRCPNPNHIFPSRRLHVGLRWNKASSPR